MMYVSAAACAACVAAMVESPHLSIEVSARRVQSMFCIRSRRLRGATHATQRKIVTVSLVPTGLLFFLHRRTMANCLWILSVNWLVTGFIAHLLLRSRGAGMGARP